MKVNVMENKNPVLLDSNRLLCGKTMRVNGLICEKKGRDEKTFCCDFDFDCEKYEELF
jgi:hypothetical protein